MLMTRLISTIILLAVGLPSLALEIKVTPGSLRNDLPRIVGSSDRELKLTGKANVTDLILLRELPRTCTTLDITGLEIEPYTYADGNYMNRRVFEANEIPPFMLFGTSVSEVRLPSGITRIGEAAFGLTALTTFTIPDSLTLLGDYAFTGCNSLKEVTIPHPVSLGKGAFRNCKTLSRVMFGYDPLEIPASFFEGCTSLQTGVPVSVSVVGEKAYRGAGLNEVDLSNVSSVGDYAFADMKALKNIIIPRSHEIIYGIGTFSNDPAIAEINDWAGNIPDLLMAHSSTAGRFTAYVDTEEIGEAAFANNGSIDTLCLGANVRLIRPHAFRNVESMREINAVRLQDRVPEVDPQSFSGLEDDGGRYPISLLVAEHKSPEWQAHPVWSLFNISEATSVKDLEGDDAASIHISRQGGRIEVVALEPIEKISVYAASGISLLEASPGTTRYSADNLPEGEVIIVKAEAGEKVKIAKLR